MRLEKKPFWLRVTLSLFGETMTRIIVPILILVYLSDDFEFAWQAKYAIVDPEKAVFGYNGCDNPCVLNESEGGLVLAFTNMADIILQEHRRLIINGPCLSACAIMADLARPFVCITPQASFHFHMGFVGTPGSNIRFVPYASGDIFIWVMERGGFPYEGFLSMWFSDAAKFWPVCTLTSKGGRIAAM